MKKIKFISVFLLALVLGISLCSCNSPKAVYNEYHKAGSELGANHIYEVISSSDLLKKIETSSDKFYVLFASSKNSYGLDAINIYDELLQNYGIDKIYLLKADKFLHDVKNKDKNYSKLKDKGLKVNYVVNFFVYNEGNLVSSLDKYITSTGELRSDFSTLSMDEVYQLAFFTGYKA